MSENQWVPQTSHMIFKGYQIINQSFEIRRSPISHFIDRSRSNNTAILKNDLSWQPVLVFDLHIKVVPSDSSSSLKFNTKDE